MICKISGKLVNKTPDSVVLDIQGISYEVLIPGAVMCNIDSQVKEDGIISLIIYHYLQVEPSRGFPYLIGFLNNIEKEFFERFITVSGIGPKAAVRALNKPISTIAHAIDLGDISLLRSLPGIGMQRAKEIVAKLQGKVGKFGLIQDGKTQAAPSHKGKEDITGEALDVLLQLQYKKFEAENMINEALNRNPDIKTAEDLLNEVYKQKTKK
ncbi:MAG: Holliday junction branch migration protein RuvA [Candidatus Omnitrophota bacterium]|jgi:Holliday junction DNA helicase RuvA|nr:Holliday junction branch migration protein RuvA [Candidatus Omnitrophota bacterium]|tara:strand:+ start:119 stop:751 length:633 start_codon:yes stop_codon:yes gene_type:complete